MQYSKSEGVRGVWLEKTIALNGLKAKLVSEVQPMEGQFGKQDVGKIQIQGEKEVKNVNINKPTINALVEAFGSESKNWTNQVLTIRTEKMVVSGKRVIAFYLIPEGFEMMEDAGGYIVISKIGDSNVSVQKEDEIVYPEENSNPEDIPF